MKNKITKMIAAMISCVTIASANIVSLNASASIATGTPNTSDSSFTCPSSTSSSPRRYSREKFTDSSVYVSNRGFNVVNGVYQYKGAPKDVTITLKMALSFKRVERPGETVFFSEKEYDPSSPTENAGVGGRHNCNNLRLKAYETRKIYQYIRENAYDVSVLESCFYNIYHTWAVLYVKPTANNSVTYGVWSPDTSNEYLYQPLN